MLNDVGLCCFHAKAVMLLLFCFILICHNVKSELCAPKGSIGSSIALRAEYAFVHHHNYDINCQNLVLFHSYYQPSYYGMVDDKSDRNQLFYLT